MAKQGTGKAASGGIISRGCHSSEHCSMSVVISETLPFGSKK